MRLQEIADGLKSVLEPLGFHYVPDQSGQGHMQFESGFFVRGDTKIGLICRERTSGMALGAVVYENDITNAAHDDLMSVLGLTDKQHVVYVESSMTSVAKDGGDLIEALRADLITLTPILSDAAKLSEVLVTARDGAIKASQDAIAQQAAKREAWLQRRLKKIT